MLQVSPREQAGHTKGLGWAQMPNGVLGRNDCGLNREMPMTQRIKSHTYEVVVLPLNLGTHRIPLPLQHPGVVLMT